MPYDRDALFGRPAPMVRMLRRVMRATPSNPRCKVCFSPFGGFGGRVVRFAGFARSRKNPNFCDACFEKAPHGGVESYVGVLFADIRGFTTMSEGMPPDAAAALLNRFYATVTDVLIRFDGLVDKLVGDEAMGLFLPYFVEDYISAMALAAEDLLRRVGYARAGHPWCPVGIGLAAGVAFVGNVGAGDVKDFTAIGDVVNTASRLQAQARAGQIVMTDAVYEVMRDRWPEAPAVALQLKGKTEPVAVHVVDVVSAVG